MNEPELVILGIAGSLRALSYNRGLLRAAVELAPAGVRVEIADIGALPLYNEDVRLAGEPAPVVALKDAARRADALLLACPEYNYSVAAPLKNAIDWLSRPVMESPMRHKPVAIMGASTGGFGTVRGQLALRQVLQFTRCMVMIEPEVMVSRAKDAFDADSNLTEAKARAEVQALVVSLAQWTRRMRAPAPAPAN